MVMVPSRYREFIAKLKELVNEGRVPMARIDDAVTRILRVKFAMGLMDPKRSQLADGNLHKSFGAPEHRQAGREAVRQSLVLLKNVGKALPLASNAKRIHVGGAAADDMGRQCGGWTIDWQGRTGAVTEGGATVLAAIKKAAGSAQVSYAADGSGAAGASVGVVAIGEKPYAEMKGDRADLRLAPEDIAAVRNMKSARIPVVVVVISGRPVLLDGVLENADAVIAAWLPGTEGAGVADVIFGAYKPTGKLSFAWPRSMEQVAAHKADLFPYGYGLTY
jgi:beta-glucosidase